MFFNNKTHLHKLFYRLTFNSNNLLIEFIGQYWHNINGWINQQRWVKTYTPDNKFLEWVTQFWQTTQWENFSRLISYYDTNGNETVFAWEMWENSAWQNHIQILYNYTTVSFIEDELENSLDYALFQNYPNPFNPTTIISYKLPVISKVTLKVYDILGNETTTLVNEEKSAGRYEVEWSPNNLSSGIYFYKLKAGDYFQTKKMIYLR